MASSGLYRTPIAIQQLSQTGRDSLNAPITEWVDWKNPVWTEKTSRGGREYFDDDGNQRYSQVTHRFRARYLEVDGIDTSMRIVFNGQAYDIRSMQPDDQRQDDVMIEATLQDGSV